jgi:prolyl-tRNA synthetase
MIMIHGDDKGLVLPPRVAQLQVVIVPITSKDNNDAIDEACRTVLNRLKAVGVRAKFDDRTTYKPGWKFNHWEVKGVPIRIELGNLDIEKNEFKVVRRYDGHKQQVNLDNLESFISEELENIHTSMYQKALTERNARIIKAGDWETFMHNLNRSNLLLTPWCDQQSCEQKVKDRSKEESKATENEAETSLTGSAKTLCKPLQQDPIEPGTKCFHCGADAVVHALWGRSY